MASPLTPFTPEADPLADLFGKHWVRREPKQDAGDLVIPGGLQPVPVEGTEQPAAYLTIHSAEFGAVPEGWRSPVHTLPAADFFEQYAPATDARIELDKLRAKIAAEDAAAEPRKLTRAERFDAAVDRLVAAVERLETRT